MFPCGASFSCVYEKPFRKMLHLKMFGSVLNICLCLNNCPVICKVTLCYVLHQTHSEFWHIRHTGICRHIQSYSVLLRHIQAYSVPCVTLAYSKPCNIQSPGIFRSGSLFKTLRKVD